MEELRDFRRGGDARPEPLRVIIADDDALARRTVRDVLQDDGVVVIAEAADGREAVELSLHYKPDIVLMDLVMPGLDGLAATRRIVRAAPAVRVVVLTCSDDQNIGVLALRSGASGFLGKSVDLVALPRTLRSVHAGEAAVSRALTAHLVEVVRRMRDDGSGLRPVRSPLTQREWEVLDLLCQGASMDDVADTLVLSAETIRSHVKSVTRKLGVRSRREAVEVARRMRSDMLAEQGTGR
jgi:two-component system, NarL family, response regulator LiaR